MGKGITEMTSEEIWAASGDMDIKEAIKSYGSPYNAAKEAVDFVTEERPIEDDEYADIYVSIVRRVEKYLFESATR